MEDGKNNWRNEEDDEGDQEIDETVSRHFGARLAHALTGSKELQGAEGCRTFRY
jgi:hypothetical protein